MQSKSIPALALLLAIPNGGARSKATAGRLKAEGVRAGVPDICLPVPRGDLASLWIELKRPKSAGKAKGTVSKAQKEWLTALEAHGNRAVVAYGWGEAVQIIMSYLALR